MIISQLNQILSLMQQTCVYLVIAYLLSKTPLFLPLMQVTLRLPRKVVCYLVFSLFCIMGTYLGLRVQGSIANTRAIGAVLGGLLGGPLVGFAVGLTGGLHRYSMGGFTAFACMLSTTAEGLVGGLLHMIMVRRQQVERLFDPKIAALATLVAEGLQMAIILLVAKPFDSALHLVQIIALPMFINNTIGAAMFMRILLDRREIVETYSRTFSTRALKIAERADGLLRNGFNQENSMAVARILYEELGVGAVAITDREKLLAFIGIGDDHHLPGTPITSTLTQCAIRDNKVAYADGNETPYRCSIRADCPLASSLVIPLRGEENFVIGTIKLYEPRSKLFSSINLTLGEGIARLLSTQILAGRYDSQKRLLAQTEIKLLHAQVNPHFLFNALNTLSGVIRRDPERARQLVLYLSTFFRKNLKRPEDVVLLADEIEHVNAYLQIQQARFEGQLTVEYVLPEPTPAVRLPAFSLQPIVENAIKHGTSQLLGPGHIRIGADIDATMLTLWVEDNAGLYQAEALSASGGLGMNLVDRRIKARYGERYGVRVECEPECLTRVIIQLPLEEKETSA